jgi:hypothetical protein
MCVFCVRVIVWLFVCGSQKAAYFLIIQNEYAQ